MTELSIEQKILNQLVKSEIIDNIHLTKSQFKIYGETKKDLKSVIDSKSFLQSADCVDYFFLEETQKQHLIDKIGTIVREMKRPQAPKSSGIPNTTVNPAEFTPCLDLESEGEYLMLSNMTGWISTVTFKSWKEMLTKEEFPIYMQNKKMCIVKYQPYSLEKYVTIDSPEYGGKHIEINSCVQPDWRYSKETFEINPLFSEFFDSLFTTEESKQFTIDWIHESIYGRNGTYLVLNGRKGLGKNILSLACSKMVGIRNYTEAPRSALTKEFNTYLKDKRLVLMDEISFRDPKEKDKLKSYLNTFQAVEGKGKDSKMIELYCSIILSSNNAKDCNIEPDDRRFSVADLSQKTLLDVFGEEKIEKLIAYIESEEFPVAFNLYLKKHKSENFNPNKPYIGPTFRELCISTLSVWQNAIYEAVTSKEKQSYYINELMTPETKDFFPRRFKDYQTFLDNFTVDGVYLGRLERGESIMSSEIVPSSKFKIEKQDNLD